MRWQCSCAGCIRFLFVIVLFNSDRVFRLAQAQSRMNNGLVDASDFDDERNGWPVEQVWKENA